MRRYNAFNRLSASRSYNDGVPQPISMAEIAAYLQILPMPTLDDRIELVDLIQDLDKIWMVAKMPKAPPPVPSKPSRSPRG